MKTTKNDCEGHPANEFDQMGQTVFCDGSCVRSEFQSLLQSAEDERREALNESDSYADSYYNLRDEGRNADGSGESYAERNA